MRLGGRRSIVLLVALVLVSTARSLTNGFVFDDVPIILENTQIHQLAAPWVYAQQSYWPPDNLGDAYRPWTVWWLALQWSVAGATPWVFHLVNLLLTLATTLLVHRLGLHLVAGPGALAGAALFAVHPAHVEATANVVGQAELWMAALTTAAVLVYARARLEGRGGPRLGARLSLALLYLLASASKEQGIVLPGLLLTFELFDRRRSSESPLERVRRLAPTYALLAFTGAAFLLSRYLVLGDLGGGPAAAGLEELGFAGRARVMAPLVLDWLRLLIWPQHLLAQYSPPAFGGNSGWNLGAGFGLAVLATLVALALGLRRRAPVVSLGIAWALLATLPVSNLLFPTGILLAERTLLLPSVGVALIAAEVASRLSAPARRPRAPARWVRPLVPAVIGLLVLLGAARSWSRQTVWRSNDALFQQTILDGPQSYRAFFVYGRDLMRRPDYARAKAMYARAAELYLWDRRVFEDWGFILRAEGRCDEAVPVLEWGVAAEPRETLARARLIECLLSLGRYQEALNVAEQGVALGGTEFERSVREAQARLDADQPRSTDAPR